MQSNTELIASIKINGSVPENQTDFPDSTILFLADEVLQQTLLPSIMEKNQEYFVVEQSFPVTANKTRYRIPPRAIGAILRDVQIQRGTSIQSLFQKNSEDVTTTATGTPTHFYIKSNSVYLYPTPSSTDGSNLLLNFFCRPGNLTVVTNAGRVTAINGSIVTVASLPSLFTVGTSIDFTKGSAHYEPLTLSNTILSIAGTDVTFSTVSSELEVGDWLSLAGTSPVPAIPEEYHPILSLLTGAKILQSQGLIDQQANLLQLAGQSMQALASILKPRVKGENEVFLTPLTWD